MLDVMYDVELGLPTTPELVSLDAPHDPLPFINASSSIDLLQPIFEKGKLRYQPGSIHDIRQYAQSQCL